MRMGIAVSVAVVLGVVAGILGTTLLKSEGVLEDQSAALEALNLKLEKAEANYQKALQAHEKLQTAYRSLKEAAQQQTAGVSDPVDLSAYVKEMEEVFLPEEAEPQARDRRQRGGDRERPELSEEERAAREEEIAQRRQQWDAFREERRLEREDSFANAIATAKNLESQERIAAIQNYQEYFGELRDAMRNAESDDERQLMREEMIESAEIYRDLVQTQRDEMLRDVAAQNGITNPAKQDAFIRDYQQLESDPLFRSGSSGYGSFGGGWGGSRGGGPGRGGFGR